ncbi:ATP-binding protein [Anabaena sp. UHCC 0187]|uniref:ATP-binding protein n=1 Tax=Anabaena sp. UHCC 0187 TaxID=2590018 RepID=UPI00144643B1|nr:ATP-binding protein [Anabaena sp. UHCC 0187]MTJ13562.1 ATP-binding protein [Anabaena sp. UHCC 0187]
MNVEDAINFANRLVHQQTNKPLSTPQTLIIRKLWLNRELTYQNIALLSGYSNDYIKKVGSKLWQILSAETALGEQVTQENFKVVFERRWNLQPPPPIIDNHFVGRESAIATLIAKLRGDCRVLILTGITGIGKTAFAGRLAVELLGNFPKSIKINFDHYQNTDFASVAALILTGSGEILTPEDRNNSQLLFNWIVSRLENNPYLLVIDSLEFILKGNGDFHDEYWEKFFNYLLSANSWKSRIIITSQDLPNKLYIIGSRYPTYWDCKPLKGFTDPEQLEFFKQAGIDIGTNLDKSDSITYLKRIGAAYEGHPLALRVITGEIISHPFYGNILAYWKKYGHEVEKVEQSQEEEKVKSDHDEIRLDRYTSSLQRAVKERVEKTFKRLANDVPNAYFMLIFGSVYSCPVGENFYLNTLETLGLGEEDQYGVLNTLRDRYLIEEMIDSNNDYLLRQHNLIRTVALEHLKKSKNEK